MPVTRQGDTTIMTPETVQAMIDQALQRNSTNTHDDESQNSGGGPGRPVQPAREIHKKKLTEKYCPKGEIKKLEIELWNLKTEKVDKYISGLPGNIHGNVMSARPKTHDDAIELANDLMRQKLCTYAERQAENKRKLDNNNQAQQQLLKKQNAVQAYVVGYGEKKPYSGSKPLCPKCNYHHDGEYASKCTNWHYKSDCPMLKNQGTKARGMVYALGGGETDQDINNMEDDINA
ncbi:hypothetical protein Tco_1082988 [Tanacetum coccineum]|uniref:Reverse transcriptase domain-containing protein n=1 Tax=Tanacetum coccineum TaxID=301880 RepID=A0ABQ5I216_9ASTR